MAQRLLFDYKRSRKWIATLASAALAFFQIFWMTLIITIALSSIFEGFFSTRLPDVTPLLIFFGLLLFVVVSSTREGLRKLTITAEAISWETPLKKAYALKRDEITKIEWKPNRIVLNQRLKIHTSSLPKKYRVLFNAALRDWAPQGASEAIQLRQDDGAADGGIGDQPVWAKSGKLGHFLLRGVGIVILSALLPLYLTVQNISLNRERILILLFLAGSILAVFGVIWATAVPRIIRVSQSGISYQKGQKARTYPWREIEAIAVENRMKRFLLWENDKQKSLSYVSMKAEHVDKIMDAIFQQATFNDIPLGSV